MQPVISYILNLHEAFFIFVHIYSSQDIVILVHYIWSVVGHGHKPCGAHGMTDILQLLLASLF